MQPNEDSEKNSSLSLEVGQSVKPSIQSPNPANEDSHDITGKPKLQGLISPVKCLESLSISTSDDKSGESFVDKKGSNRSEPANMSLRTAPRKSTRLISEIGEDKHIKQENMENRKSPQKIEQGETSPVSGRPKKSIVGDLMVVPTPEIVPEEIETDDLLKQKGVTVNKEGKLMIPSQKLSLSEELCKVGCSEKGKKQFVCQICEKVFLRKDKINYHIYSDHHDDFVRLGKGVPQILTKVDLLNNSDPDIEDTLDETITVKNSISNSEEALIESKPRSIKSPAKQTEEEKATKLESKKLSPNKRQAKDQTDAMKNNPQTKEQNSEKGKERQKDVQVTKRSPRKRQEDHRDTDDIPSNLDANIHDKIKDEDDAVNKATTPHYDKKPAPEVKDQILNKAVSKKKSSSNIGQESDSMLTSNEKLKETNSVLRPLSSPSKNISDGRDLGEKNESTSTDIPTRSTRILRKREESISDSAKPECKEIAQTAIHNKEDDNLHKSPNPKSPEAESISKPKPFVDKVNLGVPEIATEVAPRRNKSTKEMEKNGSPDLKQKEMTKKVGVESNLVVKKAKKIMLEKGKKLLLKKIEPTLKKSPRKKNDEIQPLVSPKRDAENVKETVEPPLTLPVEIKDDAEENEVDA